MLWWKHVLFWGTSPFAITDKVTSHLMTESHLSLWSLGGRGCPSGYHHPQPLMESLALWAADPQLLAECGETAEVRMTAVGLRASIFCWCWSSRISMSRALPACLQTLPSHLWLWFPHFTPQFWKASGKLLLKGNLFLCMGQDRMTLLYSSGRSLINFTLKSPTSPCPFSLSYCAAEQMFFKIRQNFLT